MRPASLVRWWVLKGCNWRRPHSITTRGSSISRKNKITLAIVGHAQVRGRDAVQLEVTTATGVKRQVLFDPQTHLIVKEAATIGGVEEEILYDDYRIMDGVKLPHKIELHRGNDKYNLEVTRAVINGTVG